MDNAVKEKRKAWKKWKNGGTKERIFESQKTALYFSKKDAQTEQFASINNNSDKKRIFKIARRLITRKC